MSEQQLTAPPADPARDDEPRGGWSLLLPYALQAVAIVVVLVAVGALAGVVWEWWWTPPTGVVVHHHWLQDENGLRGQFSGTGTYVVVAAAAGLVAGVVVSLVLARSELVTLVALLAGSLLAGWVMYKVGAALGPADPHSLAATAEDGTHLPGRLVVSGKSPLRAFPAGAVLGLTVVFLGLARHHRTAD